MSSHIGELAALSTAVCWSVSALCFEQGGQRIGSIAVNLIRLVFAIGFLSLIAWITRGSALPLDADAHAWTWLAISGLVGFTFGDLCLFRALVVLGSRLSTLVMSLVPPITALLGWAILGETLDVHHIAGVTLTVLGVGLAVTERAAPGGTPRQPGRGVLLALGGVLGQAGGLVLSKYGMGSYSALAATQIRVMAGTVGFLVVVSIIGWWPRILAARRSASGLSFTAMGSFFGPVVGVSLSLYAVQHTSTGVAASLMATAPVLIIPIVAVVYRERITLRGVAGALVALAGVVLLFT